MGGSYPQPQWGAAATFAYLSLTGGQVLILGQNEAQPRARSLSSTRVRRSHQLILKKWGAAATFAYLQSEWGSGPGAAGGQVLILDQNKAQPPRLLILHLNEGQVLILSQNEAQPPHFGLVIRPATDHTRTQHRTYVVTPCKLNGGQVLILDQTD